MATEKTKQKVQKAFLALLAERRWQDISLSDIAAKSGMDLGTLRDCYDTKSAIFSAFLRGIDKAVLNEIDESLADDAPKDRLFDILMSRFDALSGHRDAISSLMASARADPALALMLNRMTIRSMSWMLEAAGISFSGPSARLKLQGVAIAWARVVSVWLKDDDEGLSKTMAALDRELERGSDAVAMVDRVTGIGEGVRSFFSRVRPKRRKNAGETQDEAESAA